MSHPIGHDKRKLGALRDRVEARRRRREADHHPRHGSPDFEIHPGGIRRLTELSDLNGNLHRHHRLEYVAVLSDHEVVEVTVSRRFNSDNKRVFHLRRLPIHVAFVSR